MLHFSTAFDDSRILFQRNRSIQAAKLTSVLLMLWYHGCGGTSVALTVMHHSEDMNQF